MVHIEVARHGAAALAVRELVAGLGELVVGELRFASELHTLPAGGFATLGGALQDALALILGQRRKETASKSLGLMLVITSLPQTQARLIA